MKNLIRFLLAFPFLLSINLYAQKANFREYTDILNYSINLNITNFANKSISGYTELKLILNQNPDNEIILDFEALTVDSIFIEKNKVSNFKYDKRYIKIPYSIKNNNKINLTVYYHGKPIEDPSWGGFFFTDSVAFNMGVGMDAEIKSFGRVWFPCNDSFTDKALYKYKITVPKGFKAVCSGILVDSTINSDKTETYIWKMNNPIPTYVSSVTVGNYNVIKRIYKGIKRDIPIEIYVRPKMVKDAEYSFINLPKTLRNFENEFGEYVWERVGYVGVPFNSGAMEHACNIAYPEYAIDGSKDRETLFAHELSHNWFGNLVTCKTAKDMWLNEGWASYSEALFKEAVYGKEQYIDYVMNNHKKVLTYTHIADGGYFPVYGIPNSHTYGSTVYDKGADVAYTLRGVLGDSLFFITLKKYFIDNAYKSSSTEEFKKYFSLQTNVDLTDFFDTWVYTPGFPLFSIDSYSVEKKSSKHLAKVIVKQRLRERSFYGKNNKLEILFIDKNLNTKIISGNFSNEKDSTIFETNFYPEAVIIDPFQKIADTKVSWFKIIKNEGESYYDYTNFSVFANKLSDSIAVYCAANFIEPDNITKSDYIISKYMYWTISGVCDNTKNDLKTEFFVNSYENKIFEPISKIVLLYRKSNKEKFQEIESEKEIKSDYEGAFKIKGIKFGEYAIGLKK